MSWLFTRALAPYLAFAATASLVLNLMLLVPAIFSLQVFERVFTSRSVETLAMLGALVALALALAYAMDVLRARTLEQASAVLARLLAPRALHQLIASQVAPVRAESADALRDVAALRGFLQGGAVALLDAPWLLIHLAVITLMHPTLGAAAAAGALLLLLLGVATEALTRAPTEHMNEAVRNTQQQAQSLLRRADAIVGMGMSSRAVDTWTRVHEALLARQAALASRSNRLAAAARLLQQALQAALLALGAWLVIGRDASPGIMVAASLLLGRALQPAAQLIGSWSKLVGARSAWHRLREQPGVQPSAARVTLPAPHGRLQLERVVFGAHAQRAPLLKGINLEIDAGQSLGLVGGSGSGKSTLGRLMLGLWAPQSGVVRLDGADVAKWEREQLAPYIGYLPQDVELFAGTVAQNIARLEPVGPDASAAIAEAARLAHAHELILRLPQGYDTLVGEGGAALSGGQRQRIGLARALYGSPRLVVLDEPNAHLDAEGEAALVAALHELKARGTSVVVITHRTAILAALDRVAVLKNGVVDVLGQVAPSGRALRAVPRPAAPAPASESDTPEAHVPRESAVDCTLPAPLAHQA